MTMTTLEQDMQQFDTYRKALREAVCNEGAEAVYAAASDMGELIHGPLAHPQIAKLAVAEFTRGIGEASDGIRRILLAELNYAFDWVLYDRRPLRSGGGDDGEPVPEIDGEP